MAVDTQLLRQGNRRSLAKAITLAESSLERHREQAQKVLEELLPHTGKSMRIGISGVPGVGKSTFIEAFGLALIAEGKRVAVLAVDPSSPIHGGSILGDKTRMEELSRSEAAFIRPSPSGGALGGVAQQTRESILLCEAAGYDVILVETVGVGQSEFEVAAMVDFFLVLMIPNAGDELQGIKKGIMEMVDGLVINKADRESVNLAKISQRHYQNAFHLMQHPPFWTPQVLTCSALEKTRLQEVWQMIKDYQSKALEANYFYQKRARQNIDWMNKLVIEQLQSRLRNNPAIRAMLPELEQQVKQGGVTPYVAARKILDLF
jgi:LAO/AO transport system kinase